MGPTGGLLKFKSCIDIYQLCNFGQVASVSSMRIIAVSSIRTIVPSSSWGCGED